MFVLEGLARGLFCACHIGLFYKDRLSRYEFFRRLGVYMCIRYV